MYQELKEKVAGEIALSEEPGKTIRKWRDMFRITQHELARTLEISPSIISDYESGRRKSPGVATIKKIVEALVKIDEARGAVVCKGFAEKMPDAILSMREFPVGVPAPVFMNMIEGKNYTPFVSPLRDLYGYTVIDSVRAITSMSPDEMTKLYGRCSERALMFTGVKYGRGPMIAIRIQRIKPAMVVYIRPENIDELAVRLAEIENVLLVVTQLPLVTLLEKVEKIQFPKR